MGVGRSMWGPGDCTPLIGHAMAPLFFAGHKVTNVAYSSDAGPHQPVRMGNPQASRSLPHHNCWTWAH